MPLPASPAPAPAPPVDTRTAKEHTIESLRLLEKGDSEAARSELRAALRQEPDNALAKNLLEQIDAAPEETLGKESYPYTVEAGDSLSKIARRFLKDPYKFWILARYNGIENPGDLRVGQVIKIPGKKEEPPPIRPAAPSREETPPPAPKPLPPAPKPLPPAPSKAAVGDSSAERLYQEGTQALAAGSTEKAYDFFAQALQADPKHAGAQDRVRELKPQVAELYYRKALTAFRRENLRESVRNCDRVLEIDPDHEKAKLLRLQAIDLEERMKKLN